MIASWGNTTHNYKLSIASQRNGVYKLTCCWNTETQERLTIPQILQSILHKHLFTNNLKSFNLKEFTIIFGSEKAQSKNTNLVKTDIVNVFFKITFAIFNIRHVIESTILPIMFLVLNICDGTLRLIKME